MKCYKLLDLSSGEDATMYIDGIETALVFRSIFDALETRDLFCSLTPERLRPEYFEVIEVELPEEDIKQLMWTRD